MSHLHVVRAILAIAGMIHLAAGAANNCEIRLHPKPSLQDLINQGDKAVAEASPNEQLGRELRNAANELLSSADPGQLTPEPILRAFALAKKLIPEVKNQVAWEEVNRPLADQPMSLGNFADTGTGILAAYVEGIEGLLFANGKEMPTKTIYGFNIYVVVDISDDRFVKLRDPRLFWLPDANHNRRSKGSRAATARRKGHLSKILVNKQPNISVQPGQALITTTVIAGEDHLSTIHFGEPGNTDWVFTIEFLNARTRFENIDAIVRYFLSTENEHRVGSVHSGESRYRR